MAGRLNESVSNYMSKHPYSDFEMTEVWRVLDKAIQDLVSNKDITEQTANEYITGYLVKRLSDEDLLNGKALSPQK